MRVEQRGSTQERNFDPALASQDRVTSCDLMGFDRLPSAVYEQSSIAVREVQKQGLA
jgi:hypothetical protein